MRLTTDEFNIVDLLSPADRNGATFATPSVNMKDYESAIFLFNFGSLAGYNDIITWLCNLQSFFDGCSPI